MSSKYILRLKAVRPESFLSSTSSVLYALFLAKANLAIFDAVITTICALCLHAAINVGNDYFDYKKKVDSKNSIYQSSVNKTIYTTTEWFLKCFITLIAISIILGIYLTIKTDYLILIIGIACILTVYLYSGGKKPLANMAFGEFLSFLFFGPIACCGTYYIQCKSFNNIQLFNSVSIGLLVSCIMLANNIRDIDTDKKAGKYTISVRIGKIKSNILYKTFLIIAYTLSITLGNYFVLLTIPFILLIIKEKNMQKLMERSTLLVFLYSICLML
ncbi:MAG: 1,4-dihydroxy-2-naphthoate octaprenyltransferase [Holosporales bacterium]|jgi:1,4-dihydroxy-2-naphthoate octaprenyltransferase|nr:1,4-dihydroxy-2-naphthoate octaprenyltransferase [Holosporales bacterium]